MESKLFKRVLSLVVVAVMVLSMCPTFVFAEDATVDSTDPNYCPYCNAIIADWIEVEEGAWNASTSVATGHYKLTGSQSTTAQMYIGASDDSTQVVCIDLNGYDIARSGSATHRVFCNYGTLSIMDKTATTVNGVYTAGAISNGYVNSGTTSYAGPKGGNIYNAAGAKFNLYSGIVENGKVSGSKQTTHRFGGNIYGYPGSEINIYGGVVSGGTIVEGSYLNSANEYGYHGGCNIGSFGDVNIYGGTIKDGYLDNWTPADNYRSIAMAGGNISVIAGTGLDGELNALYIENATVSGGHIKNDRETKASGNCTDYAYGGNIYAKGVSVTIKDSTVSGGKAEAIPQRTVTHTGTDGAYAYGGNIYVDNGNLEITGKTTISGGKATGVITVAEGVTTGTRTDVGYGGNIYVAGNTSYKFTVGKDVQILDGTATYNGGNIQAVKMTSDIWGTVTGGTAQEYRGGNIYQDDGTMNIRGGLIADGVAKNRGGNYFLPGGTLNIYGGEIIGATEGATVTEDGYSNGVVATGATVNIYGGTINSNKGTPAVYLLYSDLNVYGGTLKASTTNAINTYCSSSGGCDIRVFGGSMEGTVRIADGFKETNAETGAETVYMCSATQYGGYVKNYSVSSKNAQTVVYSGIVAANPADYAAECTCTKDNGDGTYTVWQYKADETGLCADCGHTYAETACATCEAVHAPVGGSHTWDSSADDVQSCTVCGYEITCSNHVYSSIVVTAPTCTKGYTTYTCPACGDSYVDDYTDPVHNFVKYESNGDATCTADGTKTAVCEGCGVAEDTITDENTMLDHSYDENGNCVNGCKDIAGASVTLDGDVTYYTTAMEALVAANGTGATVHIMKNATVTMKNTFTSSNPLKDVTISTAEDVTLSDNSGNASSYWYINGVTFAQNSNFYLRGNIYIVGASEINIYGTVTAYVITVSGDSSLNVYGNAGGYLKTTGNFFLRGNTNGGHLNVYGAPESTEPVFEANVSTSYYQIANYSGVVYIENAVINIGALCLKYQEDKDSTFKPSFTAVNSTVIVRNAQGSSTTTGENSVNVWADSDGITLTNSTLTMPGTITLADDAVIAMDATSSITTTTADLQNAKVVAAEGFDGCVWYEDGVYTAKAHNADVTCTENGLCSNCNTVVNTPGHEDPLTAVPQKDATCTESGLKAYSYCSVCNDYYVDENGAVIADFAVWQLGDGYIAATDHDFSGTNGACVNDGCNATACDNGHTGLKSVDAKAPTCTENGWEAYEYCSACGYSSYVELPAGHSLVDHGAKTPTCTDVGWNAYQTCSNCDYTTYDEIAATGHNYVGTQTKAPTCTETGVMTYVCQNDENHNYTEEIAALGHTDGEDADHICDRDGCNEVASEHSYTQVVTAPNCSEQGYTTYTCACGDTYKDNYTDPDGVTHNYDDNGVCVNGCQGEAVAAVILNGEKTFYATALEAAKAADGTGATLHVLTSTEENWEDAFPATNPLNNVTITAAEGVTITADSADGEINADKRLYVDGVTFSTGVTFVTRLYLTTTGTVEIYGNVQAYILGVNGGSTVNVYGNQEIPATVTVTGTLFMNRSGVMGRLNVYGKGDGVVVLKANSSGSKNAICLYGGYLYAEDAVIKCDTLNMEKQEAYAPVVELNNAAINITETGSTWSDVAGNDYALCIQTEASFVMTNGSAVTLTDAAAVYIVDGSTIELSADSTITTTAADLKNSKIVTAEGVEGCVYYADGVYAVNAHTAADVVCTENVTCANCGVLLAEATEHSLVDHEAKAPTCTEVGWNAYQTCENCNYTTYEEIAANGHSLVDHEAKAPTCTEIGWDAYQTCEKCDYTTYVELPATHAYDVNGDCTVCGDSVIAMVTYLDGTVTYYDTFLEALVAANGTGATVKALKNVAEVLQPTFGTEETPLQNVIIDGNPGVTIEDTTPLVWEELSQNYFYMAKVTFTENVNYSQSMILGFKTGNSVINGTVNAYILGIYSGKLIINGTLNNTGNVIMTTGYVTINEGGVWNANTNSNNNFVGVYGCTLELNGGTLNCDSFNAVGRIPGESGNFNANDYRDATVIIRDGGTLNARQAIGVRRLHLTLEGENTITLAGEEFDTSGITYDTKHAWVATRKSMETLHQYDLDMTLEADIELNSFVIDRDMTITLNGFSLSGGPVELTEGGSLTLVGENNATLNVTTSLEGKCVWATSNDGTTTYTTADHVYSDWVEGVRTCTNCFGTIGCQHEVTSVVTDPTCETAGFTTHSCSLCLHVWIDTEVAALGHSYGQWSDNGDGTHSRVCATDNSHVETFDHNYESVVTEPNCSANGYTTHTCTDCGYSYQDNQTETNGVHDYDEYGDCTRCDDSVLVKVTYKDGTVEYYTSFRDAIVAADNTGATVKALKDVAEPFQSAFGTEDNPLDKVIIDSNPGVTITDTTDIPSSERTKTEFNIRGVTFTENVNFTVDYMILRFRGSTNTINGTVSTYILSMNGTTIINGTLTNTGNVMLSTGKIIINEGGVFAANSNPNIINFVGLYGGVLEINGGTLTCDNFKAVGRVPSESDSGDVNRDATVIIRDGSTLIARDAFMARKLNLTMEGESDITVVGVENFDLSGITHETAHAWLASTKSFIDEANYYKLNFTLMKNIKLDSGSYDGVSFDRDVTVDLNGYTLSGPVDLAEGGSLTVYGENAGTLTVTTALEGKCVWVTTEGTTTTYITAPHVYGDWENGEKACINCGTATDCDHAWDSGVVTAPTCEGVGYTTYTCTVCGSRYTDHITNPTGHTYGEWSDSGDGETHMRVCLIDSSHIEKVDHTEEVVVTAPTCTTDGYTTYTCTVCGSVRIDDVITASGHNFDRQEITDTYKATDATCVAAATYYYSCSCGEKSDLTFIYGEPDANAHVNLQRVDAKAATCTDSGWDAYEYCETCGHTTYVEISATGHNLTHVAGKAPTCTDIGWDAYECCSACDYTTYEEIPASGHILTNFAGKAPTCTEDGWSDYATCSVCGYSSYTVLPANGHTEAEAVKEKIAEVTCTTAGYYESVVYCSVCGMELSRTPVVVDATGHSYEAVYTPATNTENAYTTYTCHCGDTYTVVEENSMLHCAQNVRTGVTYAEVQTALNEAQSGDTVILIRDAVAADVYVGVGKTLDLNGHRLTAESVAASFNTSYISDNTEGAGLLVVDKENIALNSTNKQLPLWYDEGARFITVSFLQAINYQDKDKVANEDIAYYRFAFKELAKNTILDEFLANGSEGTGISVRIKATWNNENGVTTQYFTFSSEMVDKYVNSGRGWDYNMFKIYIHGVKELDISFRAEIVSTANDEAVVVIASVPLS